MTAFFGALDEANKVQSEADLPFVNRKMIDIHGSAFPDVSAVAVDLDILLDGKKKTVSGTSGATPVFGAVISLLNLQRLKVRSIR